VGAELVPHAPLVERDGLMPGRGIIGTDAPAWTGVQVMEWELSAAEWTDRHPHEEINHVLAGELHVTCDDTTVVAGPGDTVRVEAGSRATYAAPAYARMLAIYGPNPDAAESGDFAYRRLNP
jgi:ethanolamine utilization protein EutQ (cupin superfamily)